MFSRKHTVPWNKIPVSTTFFAKKKHTWLHSGKTNLAMENPPIFCRKNKASSILEHFSNAMLASPHPRKMNESPLKRGPFTACLPVPSIFQQLLLFFFLGRVVHLKTQPRKNSENFPLNFASQILEKSPKNSNPRTIRRKNGLLGYLSHFFGGKTPIWLDTCHIVPKPTPKNQGKFAQKKKSSKDAKSPQFPPKSPVDS